MVVSLRLAISSAVIPRLCILLHSLVLAVPVFFYLLLQQVLVRVIWPVRVLLFQGPVQILVHVQH